LLDEKRAAISKEQIIVSKEENKSAALIKD
jgi:hypothetical protein